MKKAVLISVCSALLIVVLSVSVLAVGYFQKWDFLPFFSEMKAAQNDKTVAATVNGEEIYESQIDIQLAFSELSYSLAAEQVENMGVSEEEKQRLLEQQKNSQKTRDEMLEELVKQTVILQEAARRGITVSDEEAAAYASEQYALFKEAASENEQNAANDEFLQMYIQENGWTEEDYLKQVTNVYKKLLIQNAFYKVLSEEEKIDNVDDYVNQLVAQATVLYGK
ncbi:MAG: SurA N-terminal domain-containing protein [Acutalibacteraceae bacterium]